jgi:hypothetical protein
VTTRLFAVELTVIAIVQADTEMEAMSIAEDEQRDICRDTDMSLGFTSEVKSIEDAKRHGWDERCIPYGGDGNTTLRELFEQIANEPEPKERCTRTMELPL